MISPGNYPFITVTGVDEWTDYEEFSALKLAEIGFLYAATPEGRNRYPSFRWIKHAVKFALSASLHICGRTARKELHKGALDSLIDEFDRVQINGLVENHELHALCSRYPEQLSRSVMFSRDGRIWRFTPGRGFLKAVACLFFACLFLTGCGTISPRAVTAMEPGYAGNSTSGIVSITPGGSYVTSEWVENYAAMVKVYGSDPFFKHPLAKNEGVTIEEGQYWASDEALWNYGMMNSWRRNRTHQPKTLLQKLTP